MKTRRHIIKVLSEPKEEKTYRWPNGLDIDAEVQEEWSSDVTLSPRTIQNEYEETVEKSSWEKSTYEIFQSSWNSFITISKKDCERIYFLWNEYVPSLGGGAQWKKISELVVLKLHSLHQNYLEVFVKTQVVGPTPTLWVSRSEAKSSISANFQGDASDAGLGSLLWETQSVLTWCHMLSLNSLPNSWNYSKVDVTLRGRHTDIPQCS